MRAILLSILLLLPAGAGAMSPSSRPEGHEPVYVALAPMTVPLLRGSYVEGSFHLKLRLAVATAEDKREVERLLPRLEAGYLEMLGYVARSGVRPGEAVDLIAIADALQGVTNRVLGNDHARLLIVESALKR